jgi:hypothetical protein
MNIAISLLDMEPIIPKELKITSFKWQIKPEEKNPRRNRDILEFEKPLA